MRTLRAAGNPAKSAECLGDSWVLDYSCIKGVAIWFSKLEIGLSLSEHPPDGGVQTFKLRIDSVEVNRPKSCDGRTADCCF